MPRAVDGATQEAVNRLQSLISADPEIQAILRREQARLAQTRDQGGSARNYQNQVRDQITNIAKQRGYIPKEGQYFVNPNDGQLEPHGGWAGLSNKTRAAIIAAAAAAGGYGLYAAGAFGGGGAAGAGAGAGTGGGAASATGAGAAGVGAAGAGAAGAAGAGSAAANIAATVPSLGSSLTQAALAALSGLPGALAGRSQPSPEEAELMRQALDMQKLQQRRIEFQNPLFEAVNQLAMSRLPTAQQRAFPEEM